MKVVRLKVSHSKEERNELIVALSNAGYKVWITKQKNNVLDEEHYVHIEISNKEVSNED